MANSNIPAINIKKNKKRDGGGRFNCRCQREVVQLYHWPKKENKKKKSKRKYTIEPLRSVICALPNPFAVAWPPHLLGPDLAVNSGTLSPIENNNTERKKKKMFFFLLKRFCNFLFCAALRAVKVRRGCPLRWSLLHLLPLNGSANKRKDKEKEKKRS
jgi:hypothetical protein